MTKWRKRRDDQACEPQAGTPKGPTGVLVEYAEENNQGKEVGGASGHEQSAWMIAAVQVAIDA